MVLKLKWFRSMQLTRQPWQNIEKKKDESRNESKQKIGRKCVCVYIWIRQANTKSVQKKYNKIAIAHNMKAVFAALAPNSQIRVFWCEWLCFAIVTAFRHFHTHILFIHWIGRQKMTKCNSCENTRRVLSLSLTHKNARALPFCGITKQRTGEKCIKNSV